MRDPGEDAGALIVRLIEPQSGLPGVLIRAVAGDTFFAEQGTDVPLKIGNFGPEGQPVKGNRQPTHELELIAWTH
jgi:hypothetical protein